ncbi:hypothetical protein BKA04_000035 [Cryobacterium mesophilum]|uniref:protein kinase domain-containing protein n=1 Tax=Terrimesophilobacter mesophilus TaxID=433647 RepID=UPI0014254ECC|nr:protein kinase [Terrimesophilobacter mesophilus]MBB5631812.1 hypothetical protein [Terrimesophilobacter mesophilus]
MESLGGYRLVRRLGAGANSEVWLGSDGAETVAVKVYRAEADGARIDAEIEALGRASHRHILRLEDLAMGPGGNPCLVLQRLSSLSLAGLLARSAPTPGEAVTILVPLVRAVAELHRVGVAHGALRASAVLFDDSGAAVLAGLGRAILFGDFPADSGASLPPARMAVESSVAHDLAGLVSICTATATRDEELSRWLSSCSPRDGHDFAEELVERLYSSADPTPVRLGLLRGHRELESRAGPGSIPERIGGMGRPAAEPVAPLPATDPAATDPATTDPATTGLASTELASLLHLPDDAANSLMRWMGALLERGPIATVKARVGEVLRPVRKAVWIVAGLVAVVVVAVTAVLPPGASGRDDPPVAVPVETTATPAALGPAVSAAIGGDDPALAAIALLDARAGCFSALSVLCLDAVDQQGSAAMSADAAQIRLLQAGGVAEGSTGVPPHSLQAESSPTTSDRLTAKVVERLGDSVLLAVTVTDSTGTDATGTPSGFSVLLIRIDGEWRIRDVLATGGPAG